MKHKYFISFSFKDISGATGTGNIIIKSLGKIKNMEDVLKIQEGILEEYSEFKEVVILNFIKL